MYWFWTEVHGLEAYLRDAGLSFADAVTFFYFHQTSEDCGTRHVHK
jgi:hypothetical protein